MSNTFHVLGKPLKRLINVFFLFSAGLIPLRRGKKSHINRFNGFKFTDFIPLG